LTAARIERVRASWIAMIAAGWLGCSPAVVDAPPGPDAATASGDATGAVDASTSQTCATSAYARCNYLQSCSPTAMLNRYGTMMECQAIFRGTCENALNAPSTGSTPATSAECVNELTPTGWSCSNYVYDESIPPACQPTGSLPNGAPCGVAQQCVSGYCALPLYGACGTCAAVPPAGSSCAQVICPSSLTCAGPNQTCVAFAQEGTSCSPTQPCSDGLTCVVAAGATTGTCEQAVATLNDACVFTGAGCNFYSGLACNVQTGLCATAMLGVPGQACGIVGQQLASCIGGACVRGACVASALPGEPCDVVEGPPCVAAARCIVSDDGGTAGTCQLNGSAACP
jgi:hypothetical protein